MDNTYETYPVLEQRRRSRNVDRKIRLFNRAKCRAPRGGGGFGMAGQLSLLPRHFAGGARNALTRLRLWLKPKLRSTTTTELSCLGGDGDFSVARPVAGTIARTVRRLSSRYWITFRSPDPTGPFSPRFVISKPKRGYCRRTPKTSR